MILLEQKYLSEHREEDGESSEDSEHGQAGGGVGWGGGGGHPHVNLSFFAASNLSSGSNVTTYFSLLVLNRPVI